MIKLCFVYCVMILSRISMFVVSYDCCFARTAGNGARVCNAYENKIKFIEIQ